MRKKNPTTERIASLLQALDERILVLDGAMGTALQGCELGADDFGGEAYEGCNEQLNLTRPEVVGEVHRSHLEAGADVIETNTFGATSVVLEEYGLGAQAAAINQAAARLAREQADAFSSNGRMRWVAGAMGPTTKALSVTGGISFAALVETFREQALALAQGGVDFLLLETTQDTRNLKAALLGIEEAFSSHGSRLPIAVSITIETMGTMLAGQTAEALCASLEHVELLYLGLNCATGPAKMSDHLRALSRLAPTRVACVPNAGLPSEDGSYAETPEGMANVLRGFGESGWLNLIGGCCGTTPAHTAAFVELARNLKPREVPELSGSTLSGTEALEITEERRPILVGERTNVIGSRKFKRLVVEGRFEEAAEVGKAQVKAGASILDVCLANPDRDELADMEALMDRLVRKVRAPLMIDSTDPEVMERALRYCQGKAILNSVNLEDGEARFEAVVPLARRYGAALVVGCIDEAGMAVSRERKLEVALRSHELLVKKYGMREEDLAFDPLVFPCATGDAQYVGSATETIEGIRLIKEALPRCKTVLGISNVSFGLPAGGREVMNSVFLYHCVRAGLDLAIVNSEALERFPSIPEELRTMAQDLLHGKGDDPIAAFSNRFREAREVLQPGRSDLPLDERIARHVVDGSREGLIEDLEEKRRSASPLEIINGPLMAGMDEVGRLFGSNQLIVAEVLQSAEVMKAAVDHLEKFMEKGEAASRGKVLLATVKGDVHDIGKNLVDIIFSNNGFEVIDLGIKVPPATLLEAIRTHGPDMVGLSGLLVKSAQQMAVTAEEFAKAGVEIPLLVGGAALTRSFTERKIASVYRGKVRYAQDAMAGLDIAKKIAEPEGEEEPAPKAEKVQAVNVEPRPKVEPEAKVQATNVEPEAKVDAKGKAPPRVLPVRSSAAPTIEELPAFPPPPDLGRHLLRDVDLERLWRYINPMMLYGRHLGLKGKLVRRIEELTNEELGGTEWGKKALAVRRAMEEIKGECLGGMMRPVGVYQFFQVEKEGERIHVLDEDGKHRGTFSFRRQARPGGLCLSDLVAKKGDNFCIFVVSAGKGIREAATRYKNEGAYLRSYGLQALALETAEAFAEVLHQDLRGMWGFPDGPETTMLSRFRADYRGKRYSLGYPACPDMEGQKLIFDLLDPRELGIELTDGFMMEPEASVSALVFHHPAATYFTVDEEDGEDAAAAGGV